MILAINTLFKKQNDLTRNILKVKEYLDPGIRLLKTWFVADVPPPLFFFPRTTGLRGKDLGLVVPPPRVPDTYCCRCLTK